jgi:hypothetical protein
VARGDTPAIAQQKALAMISGQVTRQAAMLSFEQLFLLFGLSLATALPLLLFMRRARNAGGGMAH